MKLFPLSLSVVYSFDIPKCCLPNIGNWISFYTICYEERGDCKKVMCILPFIRGALWLYSVLTKSSQALQDTLRIPKIASAAQCMQ